MEYFDIIIIGGGPAGSTCAMALAASGLQVAVIEKARFPRNKVCGDAVAAYVPKVLHAINPKYSDAIDNFTEKTIVDTCRIIAPNKKHIDIISKESGFISTRTHLDNFLYELTSQEKNISWFLNEEVTGITIEKNNQQTTVTTNKRCLNAKLLIGCDGAHSITSKKLTANKTTLNHYSGAVRAYYKNVSGFATGVYELHFLAHILPGYFWIFPLNNNMANVGLCIPSATISRKNINLRQTMQDVILNNASIKNRFEKATLCGKIEGYGLPLGSTKKTISGDYFMLAGDAASLIDPATGEGIGQSMIAGRYAAWQAIQCFEKNNFTAGFMQQYDQQLYKKLYAEARKSHWIQKLFFNNATLFNTAFSLLNKNKFLRDYILKQVTKL